MGAGFAQFFGDSASYSAGSASDDGGLAFERVRGLHG